MKSLPAKSGVLLKAIACYFLVGVAVFTGATDKFDRLITEQRFRFLSEEVPSDIIVVGIDTKALQAIPEWPWDRSKYGELTEIITQSGATAIAFDIDFSAPGDASGNKVFAEAIERSGVPVILAAQRQSLSEDLPDFVVEIFPHPELSAAVDLMAVNYPVDNDGTIRRGVDSIGFRMGLVPSPSHALLNRPADGEEFHIDFSIKPSSFDTVSVIDVLNGNFEKGFFRGKKVIVGAVALELGDEFSVPVYGVLPGVVINAMGYETIRTNHQLFVPNLMWVLVAAAGLWLLIGIVGVHARFVTFMWANFFILTMLIVVPVIIQASFHIMIPTTSWHIVQFLGVIFVLGTELEKRAKNSFYAQMKARDSHSLLKTLISENHEGFIVVNRRGNVELINERAAKLLGIKKSIPAGTSLEDVESTLYCHLKDAREGNGLIDRFELVVEQDAASAIALDVTVSRASVPLAQHRLERRTDDRIFVVFALHDISTQKLAAEEQRKAKETYAQLNAAKSQLINTMNHELRTPLNHIIGFSDLLKNQVEETSLEYVDYISSSGHDLLDILNDMLHAAQIQAGDKSANRSTMNAKDLVESAVLEAKRKKNWRNQQVEIIVDQGCSNINADQSMMKLALVHLLDNAAKFAGEHAWIQVKVENSPYGFDLSVKDNGPGCSEDTLPGLTKMFTQGDGATTRSYEGCGLGLYLVSEIASLHGGELTLSSQVGCGFEARILTKTTPDSCVQPVAA